MPIVPLTLGIKSNPSRNQDAARLINCYVEDAGDEGKIKSPIYSCDGFSNWATLTGTGVGAQRAAINIDDTYLYVVAGSRINRVSKTGVVEDLGAFTGTGMVTMARNMNTTATQIGVVSESGEYIIIEGTTVTQPTLPVDLLPNSICCLDGYFILTTPNGDFYASEINDGHTIDSLNFASAVSRPDGLMRGMIRARDVVLAGSSSLEFWNNTGATDFPFERAATVNMGCYAAAAMVNLVAPVEGTLTDTIIWPATNSNGDFCSVMMLNGYQGVDISPPALDRAIRDEPVQSSIRAFTYSNGGHTFYTITGSTFTWEWDAATGLWHERQSSGLGFWRIADSTSFANMNIHGDYTLANLYKAEPYLTPPSTTTLELRQSDTLGKTWSGTRSRTIGTTGDWKRRVRINRLGQSRKDGKVFEITLTNAINEAGVGVPMTVKSAPVHAYPNRMRYYALHVDTTPGVSGTSASKGLVGLSVDAEKLAP